MAYKRHKCAVIFLTIVVIFLPVVSTKEESHAEIRLYNELREQCLFRLNITTFHDQNLTHLACMDRCILEKVGIITRDGAFHTENIPEDIRQVAIVCNKETKHLDACQRAQSYNLCVFKAVGIKVLSEVCANETDTIIDYELMPKSMMNLTDDSMSCYNRCMLIKIEKIDSANHINANLLKIYIDDDDKVGENVRFCEEANKQEDKCVQAVQRELCIMERLID